MEKRIISPGSKASPVTFGKTIEDINFNFALMPEIDSETGKVKAGYLPPVINPDDTGYDFFIGLGQSNMQGFTSGINVQTDSVSDVDQFNNNPTDANYRQFITATVPLQMNNMFYYEGKLVDCVSPLLSFSKWYKGFVQQNRRVCLLLHAQGGTGFSVNNWNPGNELYEAAIAEIIAMLATAPPNSRIKAILWCQGEADSSMTKQQYSTDFDAMVSDLNTRVPSTVNVPWVLIGATPDYRNTGAYDSQREVNLRHPNMGYIEGASFAGAIDPIYQPNVHYSAKGQRGNGRAAAYKLIDMLSESDS